MPRHALLTEQQRVAFAAPATEERTMVRHYTLTSEDLLLIAQRRGDQNRLGFAVLLCYLRFPGRVLAPGEEPPPAPGIGRKRSWEGQSGYPTRTSRTSMTFVRVGPVMIRSLNRAKNG